MRTECVGRGLSCGDEPIDSRRVRIVSDSVSRYVVRTETRMGVWAVVVQERRSGILYVRTRLVLVLEMVTVGSNRRRERT